MWVYYTTEYVTLLFYICFVELMEIKSTILLNQFPRLKAQAIGNGGNGLFYLYVFTFSFLFSYFIYVMDLFGVFSPCGWNAAGLEFIPQGPVQRYRKWGNLGNRFRCSRSCSYKRIRMSSENGYHMKGRSLILLLLLRYYSVRCWSVWVRRKFLNKFGEESNPRTDRPKPTRQDWGSILAVETKSSSVRVILDPVWDHLGVGWTVLDVRIVLGSLANSIQPVQIVLQCRANGQYKRVTQIFIYSHHAHLHIYAIINGITCLLTNFRKIFLNKDKNG